MEKFSFVYNLALSSSANFWRRDKPEGEGSSADAPSAGSGEPRLRDYAKTARSSVHAARHPLRDRRLQTKSFGLRQRAERDCQRQRAQRDVVSNLDSQAISDRQELLAETLSEDCQRSDYDSSSALTRSETPVSTIATQWYQSESSTNFYALDLSEVTSAFQAEPTDEPPQPKLNYLGKILLVASLSYLSLVVCWLFKDRSGYLLAQLTGKQQIVLSKSDAEFIDYMERSLSAIDSTSQQDAAAKETAKERVVYVPVFTPQTPVENQPTAIPSTQPPEPLEVVKIPSPPPLPAPTPVPESPSVKTSTSQAATAKIEQPVVEHTLIGVLELGSRSAALFKIKGTTEQIWQGEEINGSGWILDSVTDQKAQINNQGEVRSLSIGEKF